MIFANIDTIGRRWLLEKGLPIHYYLEVIMHCATCLRELNFDTLKMVRSVRLPVNDYSAVDLPGDFVDDVAVTLPVGNQLQPLAKNSSLNPLRTTDSDGAFTTYGSVSESSDTFYTTGAWFWNVNEWGESTGRYFGVGGSSANTYQVIKERRQIQLSETFAGDEIILMYISDGQSADNATQIDVQAWATISAYISWKTSPKADIKDSYECRTFDNEKRKLRARLNDLSISDVRAIIYKNYTAAPKN